MANVLHRVSKVLIHSANTPDHPTADWIIGPDLSAVAGFDKKYWVIIGDVVSLMDATARAAVDASELQSLRDTAAAQLQQAEDVLRAFMLIVLDEFNAHAERVNAILDAVDGASSLATLKTAVAAINNLPSRTEQQLRNAIRTRLGS